MDGRSNPIRALPTPHSFHTPQGVSLWTARAAHWSFRNPVKQQAILPNRDSFMSQWIRVLSQVILWEPLHSMSAPLLQFHDALATLSQTGALPTGIVTAQVDDSSNQDKYVAKKRRTQERKQQLAVEAKEIIKQSEEEGWNLVFTDGSAKHHPKISWVAGFGCTWMGKWETKGHLHPSTAQTNNQAEIQAVITVLHLHLQF